MLHVAVTTTIQQLTITKSLPIFTANHRTTSICANAVERRGANAYDYFKPHQQGLSSTDMKFVHLFHVALHFHVHWILFPFTMEWNLKSEPTFCSLEITIARSNTMQPKLINSICRRKKPWQRNGILQMNIQCVCVKLVQANGKVLIVANRRSRGANKKKRCEIFT